MNKQKKAIYAGSFDPLHDGHVSILLKALKLFDYVYLVVSINPDKDNYSNLDLRYQKILQTIKKYNFTNVEVLLNKDDFIANIAKKYQVNFLIRSARNDVDFSYELELAAGNKHLNEDLETVLLVPDHQFINFSSTLIRHKEKLNK
ncbi:pantetheine-phosphate adenylyltransferase [Mycoplasmopsis alligatoris]|uniref:Phosphopantetheine adenylyltransferase n=1 Tax=Mycoplasmopsis alligatoris A21JP2 TaxID=747682 RepID=D4XV72_9BACT|nr:pantetheine-phosphate adenylyltransferase [Mycoplasmopsis alligatoris]EFF41780.1 pantetheine-phosphate adenylyltransferase [Mycoplasmopsis alligatoris A21JP2]